MAGKIDCCRCSWFVVSRQTCRQQSSINISCRGNLRLLQNFSVSIIFLFCFVLFYQTVNAALIQWHSSIQPTLKWEIFSQSTAALLKKRGRSIHTNFWTVRLHQMELFFKSSQFMSCVHLGKSPPGAFGKATRNLEGNRATGIWHPN